MKLSIFSTFGITFSLVIILISGLSVYSLTRAVQLSEDIQRIYTGPLQTINYSRSAQVNFALMKTTYGLPFNPHIAISKERLDELMSEYYTTAVEDLDVVQEWSNEPKSFRLLADIKSRALLLRNSFIQKNKVMSPDIQQQFDELNELCELLVEYEAAYGVHFIPFSSSGNKVVGWALAGSSITLILLVSIIIYYRRKASLLKSDTEKSHKWILSIINNMKDGFVFFDEEGKVLLINKRFINEFGLHDKGIENGKYELAKIYEKIIASKFKFISQEQRIAISKKILDVNSEENHIEFQSRENKWWQLRKNKTSINGTIHIWSDITHDIKQKKDLWEAQKISSLTSLVTGVAHEINTPVGVCITVASHLKDTLHQTLDQLHSNQIPKDNLIEVIKEIEEYSSLLHNNLQRTSKLIKVFKQISVFEWSEEKSHQFNLYENITHTVSSLREEINGSQCKIRIECDQSLTFFGMPSSFSQVYTNLILNSLNHGFDNWDGQKNIDIILNRKNNTLYINYKDSGRGMNADMEDKIFEPFVTTKRGQKQHFGLGAHVVFNIVVHLLKGKISCSSQQNQGVNFDISIPCPTEEHAHEYK
ncbi:PAS domain-containing sensor histidine kinase [Vibrio sp. S4M6]|nr:PAS domain-containing sensor histidine kinase [Vibrio sinus]MCL9783756.1 PAS domain-containing sensor histidine kinase [Vibrio sinus]